MNTFTALGISVLLSQAALAQTTTYQQHEVEQVAQPRGGQTQLDEFLTINLQPPLSAMADGVKGRVIVKAVVEPDGRVSHVETIRSLRPDCDREAGRVVQLYNAWKPAQKDGRPVRQELTLPVTFSPTIPFLYQDGVRTDFFNRFGKQVAPDAADVACKQLSPVDSAGLPTGDVVVYQRVGEDWQELYRYTLTRKEIRTHAIPVQRRIRLATVNPNGEPEGAAYELYPSGRVAQRDIYRNGQLEERISYADNGLVMTRELISTRLDNTDPQQVHSIRLSHWTYWHPNGQLARIETESAAQTAGKPATRRPRQLLHQWDEQGNVLVRDGEGTAVYQHTVRSAVDTARQVAFRETGLIRNGQKEGVWSGHYADDSYSYEETYSAGESRGGKAVRAGKAIAYDVVEQNPYFEGGPGELGRFLSRSMRYPREAQKRNEQGRVFVSFIVNTDGSLSNYELVKGVSPPVDAEAMRVVRLMDGRWKPGKLRGEVVRVKYTLPLSFMLQ